MAIREFEKNILTEMDFVEKVTSIREKFIKRESDEILKCDNKSYMGLVDAKYNMKHRGGGI